MERARDRARERARERARARQTERERRTERERERKREMREREGAREKETEREQRKRERERARAKERERAVQCSTLINEYQDTYSSMSTHNTSMRTKYSITTHGIGRHVPREPPCQRQQPSCLVSERPPAHVTQTLMSPILPMSHRHSCRVSERPPVPTHL